LRGAVLDALRAGRKRVRKIKMNGQAGVVLKGLLSRGSTTRVRPWRLPAAPPVGDSAPQFDRSFIRLALPTARRAVGVGGDQTLRAFELTTATVKRWRAIGISRAGVCVQATANLH
jgi:hypothetical protein